jgi:hypothetical protein
LGRDRLPAAGTFPDVRVVRAGGRAEVPVVALLELLLLRRGLLRRWRRRDVAPLDKHGRLRHSNRVRGDDHTGTPARTPTWAPPTRTPTPTGAPTPSPTPARPPQRGADDDAHADTTAAATMAASGKCRSARENHRERRHGSHGGVQHLHAGNNAPEPDPVDCQKRVVTTFTNAVRGARGTAAHLRRSKPARGPGRAGGLPSGPGMAERSDK